MRTPQEDREPLEPGHLGLVAMGRAGAWQVSLNESIAAPDRWVVEIESDVAYLTFDVASPAVIVQLAQFLRPLDASTAARDRMEMSLGTFNEGLVRLLRDDEFPDRHFLWAGKSDAAVLRLTIAGKDLKEFKEAAAQVAAELRQIES